MCTLILPDTLSHLCTARHRNQYINITGTVPYVDTIRYYVVAFFTVQYVVAFFTVQYVVAISTLIFPVMYRMARGYVVASVRHVIAYVH